MKGEKYILESKNTSKEYTYDALFLQFLCTILIFLDSGLYFPRPSNPTPIKAAPSIMFWAK